MGPQNPAKKANRLLRETSPYLLQHAYNPVDWYPWGPEAFGRAKRENKPIFLSVGYSACHWCHVMEKESFEDPKIAELLNQHFVSVKVDREERPDVDAIYMAAVQAMTQHGGWPMSVFLTPDQKPFYGGTYFPPTDRAGLPSFERVLVGVLGTWKSKRNEVVDSAEAFTTSLRQLAEGEIKPVESMGTLALVDGAVQAYEQYFDSLNGGFGAAPKFFHTMDLRVCLRHWKRTGAPQSLEMVKHSLEKWSEGGIYDHLGGGFHRYSTDAEWFAPHFEKMLYDNALVAHLYLEAFQATRDSRFAQSARETLDYLLREMQAEEGGFYSAQDADTEGVEGKFYVWSEDEIKEVLGEEEARIFCAIYGVRSGGNWEGSNILYIKEPLKAWADRNGESLTRLQRLLAEARKILFARRKERVAPFRDEKVLVSWNGLAIQALAFGHQVLGEEAYLKAAQKAAGFLLDKLWNVPDEPEGLLHSYKDGQSRYQAYLDDYANLINGLTALYESDFNTEWIRWAVLLTEKMVEQFWENDQSGFYFTGKDHESLIARTREYQDGATPSANSMAVTALVRLGRLCDRGDFLKKAEDSFRMFHDWMEKHPSGAGQLLVALDSWIHQPKEVVLVGDPEDPDFRELLGEVRSHFLPSLVVTVPGDSPSLMGKLWDGKVATEGKATAYVCQQYTCRNPVKDSRELRQLLTM